MRIIRTAHVLAIKYAGQAAWTSQKKKRKNTKELENPKKIVKKKNMEQEKTRRKQGKNNIEKRIRLCLLPGRVWAGPGLARPGLAWLSAVGFYILFLFLGQVYADAESRWKEREKEGGGVRKMGDKRA